MITSTPRWKRHIMTWLLLLLTIFIVWLALGYSMQRKILFPRYVIPALDYDAFQLPVGAQRLTIQTSVGNVDAIFIPAANSDADHPAPLVVFAHGNAELIDFWPDLLEPYHLLGLHVLLVEYRGYGRSAGSPSQKAITEDFLKAIEHIIQLPGVDPSRLIYHGRSIGGGVLCDVARTRPPAAFILQSTFTSTGAIAARFLYPPFLIRDPFNNADFLKNYTGPVLLLHGELDNIISPNHSKRLHELAPNSTLILYPAGHNDMPIDSEQFWSDIAGFLTKNQLISNE